MSMFAGLKVGLIGPLPPPAGGMAMQTRQLAGLLADAGAAVTLVQTNASYRPAWIGRVPALRALARLLPYLWALWRAAGRSDLFHVMANSGWSWHLFAAPAIWIARLRGVPVVVNYRGGEAGPFLEQQGPVVRFSMSRVAALCVPSGFLQAVFARHGMAAEIVPNIVDLACFRPTEVRPATPRLVVARNLESIYDNATALRALARVRLRRPDATMTVAGSGPLANELRALAVELGLEGAVEFAGRLDRQAVAEALRASSVSINPSLVDNTPNSVLEALASGVPVVSTAVGGVPFIVRDGETALLVPPGDAHAMAEAVLCVLEDAELSQRLAQAGMREARRYAWPQVGPVLADVYRRVTGPSVKLSPCTRD